MTLLFSRSGKGIFLVLLLTSLSWASEEVGVAVAPFQNLTGQEKAAWIGAGFAESLTGDLKRIPGLRVIERSQLKAVLEELKIKLLTAKDEDETSKAGKLAGVDLVVVGSYQVAKDRIKVDARVVEVGSAKVLRSYRKEGKTAEIFSLQDSLAEDLAAGFGFTPPAQVKTLIETPQTKSMSAYEMYVKGRESYLLSTQEGFRKAEKAFRSALDLDEKYALAWAGLGQVYAAVGYFLEQRGKEAKSYYEKSREYCDKALSIDPILYEAHGALAHAYLQMGKIKEAAAAAQEALKLNPGGAESWEILAHANPRGDPAWIKEKLDKALSLDPYLFSARLSLGNLYVEQGKYGEALDEYKKVISLDPDLFEAYNNLGVALKKMEKWEEAADALEKARALDPSSPAVHKNLGMVLIQMDKVAEGRREIEESLKLDPNQADAEEMKSLLTEEIGK